MMLGIVLFQLFKRDVVEIPMSFCSKSKSKIDTCQDVDSFEYSQVDEERRVSFLTLFVLLYNFCNFCVALIHISERPHHNVDAKSLFHLRHKRAEKSLNVRFPVDVRAWSDEHDEPLMVDRIKRNSELLCRL